MQTHIASLVRVETLWMLVRTDDAGNNFLVKEDLSQEEAKNLEQVFEIRGHKQTWHSYSYTKDSREDIIKRYRIHI